MTAAVFVQAARGLKGARWRHRGRKPWAVDCIGLLILAAEEAGLDPGNVPRRYGREPWDDQLRQGLRERFGAPVPDPAPGDIALIRWQPGEPTHVAVLADHPSGGLSMIHAHNLHGVVEHALSGPYLDAVVEVYRPWPGKSSQP